MTRAYECALSSTRQILLTIVILYLTMSLEEQYGMLMLWATGHSRTQVIQCYHTGVSDAWRSKPFLVCYLRCPNFKITCTAFTTTRYLKPGAQEGAQREGKRRGEKRLKEEKINKRRRERRGEGTVDKCKCGSSSLKECPYGETMLCFGNLKIGYSYLVHINALAIN